MEAALLITTVSNMKEARDISRQMVGERLAACATTLPASSIYTWNGKIEEADEYTILFKTTTHNAPHLLEAIRKAHPYQTPEIIQVPLSKVNRPYMDWLISSVK